MIKDSLLYLDKDLCCGYSKESSQLDGSFEHPTQIIKLMDNIISTILLFKTVHLHLCKVQDFGNIQLSLMLSPCLLVSANSLDPDQARQNMEPDLDPNRLTL